MDASLQSRKRGPGQRLILALQKYLAVMRVSIASNLAYMMEVFFRGLFLIVLIFVLGQLWKTTYSARGAKLLSGFSISDMIWYLAATRSLS
jgi:ABC-2 type transport system permease protein